MDPDSRATRFVPEFRFHPDEKYFPCDVTDYVRHSEVKVAGETLGPGKLINGKPEDLSFMEGAKIKLKDGKKYRAGNTRLTAPTELYKEPPVYYKLEEHEEYTDIIYVITYAYNGTFMPHNYDEECCCVRLSKNEKISRVFLSEHGGGKWCRPIDMKIKDGRPVVYVCKSSHAMKAKPGVYFRLFGFGSDFAADGGKSWRPRIFYNLDSLPKNKQFMAHYNGWRSDSSAQNFTPKNKALIEPRLYRSPTGDKEYIKEAMGKTAYTATTYIALIIAVLAWAIFWYIIVRKNTRAYDPDTAFNNKIFGQQMENRSFLGLKIYPQIYARTAGELTLPIVSGLCLFAFGYLFTA